MIVYDRTRYSDLAWENLYLSSPRRWEQDHGHCPRCGSWIHGSELGEDDACTVCRGKDVKGE